MAAVAAVFLLPPIVEPVVGRAGRPPRGSPTRWPTSCSRASPSSSGARAAGGSTPGSRSRLGFALIAVSDSVYVRAQTGDGWSPGTLGDLGYAAGSMRSPCGLALAAGGRGVPTSRVVLPIAFTVTSFALVCYEAFAELDGSPSP